MPKIECPECGGELILFFPGQVLFSVSLDGELRAEPEIAEDPVVYCVACPFRETLDEKAKHFVYVPEDFCINLLHGNERMRQNG